MQIYTHLRESTPIQDLILRLVIAHAERPIKNELVFDDPRYTIHARQCYHRLQLSAHIKHSIGPKDRAVWTFGQQVAFYWGTRKLEAAEEKWTFWFRLKHEYASSDAA